MTNKNKYINILHVKEEENSRISEFLINEINQNLISLKLMLDLIEGESWKRKNKSNEFRKLKNILDNSIYQISEVSSNLYPIILKDLGLKSALNTMIKEFENRTKNIIRFYYSIDSAKLESEINFYRLIEDLLSLFYSVSNNVHLDFEVFEKNKDIVLQISHSFISSKTKKIFPITDKNCNSIFNKLKTRIQLLNGSYKIISAKLNKDELIIKIPIVG